MIYKERIGHELYVYMNGSLLYKRWLTQDHGIVIQSNAWGNFRSSDVWQHIYDNKIAELELRLRKIENKKL